jgi:hypothetical protein
MRARTTPKTAMSRAVERLSAARAGRQRAIRTIAAKNVRSRTAPPGPRSSKTVVTIAEPSWTEKIPPSTIATAGPRPS